tara:strand:- start:208 stop:585 length:378 start_codon:yes stop_codon:yes gene_type:complete
MQIEIDFEVFKALTSRRQSETHSYNDVLREILGLEPAAVQTSHGRALGGRFLPNGTELRARYKGQVYSAEIVSEKFVHDGKTYSSASAAAKAVTGTNVNGLQFWEVKRPGDVDWKSLKSLQKAST